MDIIYLDFAKAFDKVDHGVLLHKVRDLGITGKLGIWLHSFLLDRKQFVRIAGGVSSDSLVTSGVPQGTVLGPLLFLILMCDIDLGIVNSRIVSFADDTQLYTGISTVKDCDSLQSDLNLVYCWAEANNMVFNSQKFKYLSFSPSVSHCSFNLYTSPEMNLIDPIDQIKDLGIIMSSDCSFKQHITELCKRCSGLCGWILRTFSSRDPLPMMTLFKAIILSRLDYGSQLWSPSSVSQTNMVEKLQRAFTKHIAGMNHLSYQERLKALHLYSLQRRRERYIMIYMWKILEKKVPNLMSPIEFSISDRRGRCCKVSNVATGRLGSLAHGSFRWKGIRLFNSLPKSLRNLTSCSPSLFKKKLDLYLLNLIDNPSVPNVSNSLDKLADYQ